MALTSQFRRGVKQLWHHLTTWHTKVRQRISTSRVDFDLLESAAFWLALLITPKFVTAVYYTLRPHHGLLTDDGFRAATLLMAGFLSSFCFLLSFVLRILGSQVWWLRLVAAGSIFGTLSFGLLTALEARSEGLPLILSAMPVTVALGVYSWRRFAACRSGPEPTDEPSPLA